MTSKLSYQQNDAISYFTCSCISRHWELFFQNRSRGLFPPVFPPISATIDVRKVKVKSVRGTSLLWRNHPFSNETDLEWNVLYSLKF